MRICCLLFVFACCCLLPAAYAEAGPSLTIYNQDFAVVRDTVVLDLKLGTNKVAFTETTAHLEPDSVILRDPAGKWALQILEQNYRADPVSQELLLSLYEGKTIDFEIWRGDQIETARGKIIRSGYVPTQTRRRRQYSQPRTKPIIELNGKLRFGLPGTPLFPALADDTILKPTLHWLIETDQAGKLTAELAYVTGGMNWEADYNLVAPEKGNIIDLVGWITMNNQSGKTFEAARIKLMAGDVSKIQEPEYYAKLGMAMEARGAPGMAPPVTEKAFDEYHLYTLARTTTLRDRETKQVEFVRAAGVKSERIYIYDGARIDRRFGQRGNVTRQRDYGTQSNKKVWVMREFVNSEENNLGIPLPRGRVRFYRRDEDGQLEFVGENIIDHTPRDETIRLYTGNSFDLVGERKQTGFKIDKLRNWLNESFEISVRNRKEKEDVEIRVVEHLYRWSNWEIKSSSQEFTKTDSRTIEFRVNVPAGGEKKIKYTVHYSW